MQFSRLILLVLSLSLGCSLVLSGETGLREGLQASISQNEEAQAATSPQKLEDQAATSPQPHEQGAERRLPKNGSGQKGQKGKKGYVTGHAG